MGHSYPSILYLAAESTTDWTFSDENRIATKMRAPGSGIPSVSTVESGGRHASSSSRMGQLG
eukprot:508605-Rhodomonas_salina.5